MNDALEAVINVSEGRDPVLIDRIGRAAGRALVDVHSDRYHHRSVFTLAGEPELVEAASFALASCAVELLDLSRHEGVHPRLGVVDVVPFVPIGSRRPDEDRFALALEARRRFAEQLSSLGVPCFYYGIERALPVVRKLAFKEIWPDLGPNKPHPTAGACCVGVRDFLVAYNLVVDAPLAEAKEIARRLRRPEVRTLGLALGEESQVSCNLVAPLLIGPDQVYDEVAEQVPVIRSELVGLVPEAVLSEIDPERWAELDLSPERTIEAALAASKPPS